jgi:nucleoside-diphosphate-sugar epimerase
MIIGNGLLAQAFAPTFTDDPDVIVFASGVSNSRETRPEAFARERALLSATLTRNGFILYFSTCSTHDPELVGSPYVRHKIEMERLAQSAARCAIFRLPQVVGHTPNPHTLTNHLHRQISAGTPVQVWLHARRNLIDVSDVAAIVTRLVRNHQADRVVTNIACPFSIAIPDLVRIFEQVLDIRAVCDNVDAGASYDIEAGLAIETARQAGIRFDQHYVSNLIWKYYAKSTALGPFLRDPRVWERKSTARTGVATAGDIEPD